MLRALVVTAILAIPSIAAAGPYGSLGIGTTGVNDSGAGAASIYDFSGNGRSWRAALGYRFAPLSIVSLGRFNPSFSLEGGYSGFGVEATPSRSDVFLFSADEFYVAGKVNVPLGHGLEAFGKAGIQHTSFNTNNDRLNYDDGNNSESGTGWLAGAGLEFRLSGISGMPPILGNSSIWLDWVYNQANMTNTVNESRGIATDMLTIGLTVGF